MTLLLVNRRDRLHFLALVLVLSGVFQAAFGVLMTLSGFEYGFFIKKEYNLGVVTGTFVNPNHLAAYLGMCLALAVGLVMANISTLPAASSRDRARALHQVLFGYRARLYIALAVMVVALVLSKSRMGNIAFLSSLLVACVYYILVIRRVTIGIVAFFFSVFLIGILMIGNIFDSGGSAQGIRQTSLVSEVSRIEVGRDALEIVREYPLTGTGAGSFTSAFPMYDSGKIGSWHYKHVHNDYLQFASEFGLPGLAMLAGIVLLSVWQSARAQFKRNDRFVSGLGCGVSMALIAILIHTAVDFNLQIPANAATFVVILAMGWHTRWPALS
jgi:O-antigen ligase